MGIIVKHVAGWIKPDNMDTAEWLHLWKDSAEKANNENCDLVAFRIPRDRTGSSDYAVSDIEKYLQEKFDPAAPKTITFEISVPRHFNHRDGVGPFSPGKEMEARSAYPGIIEQFQLLLTRQLDPLLTERKNCTAVIRFTF